jgi:hemophore-related protein
MAELSLTRLAVGVCGLALSLTAGAGLASADRDLSPFVNTTCNYGQVTSALQAADPQAAAQFNSSPESVSFLRQFLASPPSQRQQMAQMLASQPGADQQFGLLQRVFSTCNNY